MVQGRLKLHPALEGDGEVGALHGAWLSAARSQALSQLSSPRATAPLLGQVRNHIPEARNRARGGMGAPQGDLQFRAAPGVGEISRGGAAELEEDAPRWAQLAERRGPSLGSSPAEQSHGMLERLGGFGENGVCRLENPPDKIRSPAGWVDRGKAGSDKVCRHPAGKGFLSGTSSAASKKIIARQEPRESR